MLVAIAAFLYSTLSSHAGATPSVSPSGPVTPPAVGVTVTISGTVVEGAEPSCLILRTDRGQFELLSKTQGVRQGDQVTATGHVAQVMTHCMQGKPFQVDSLTVRQPSTAS